MSQLQVECVQRHLIDDTVLKTESFLKSQLNTITTLLTDKNCSWKEVEIWGAVINWAKRLCRLENLPQTPTNIRLRQEGGGILRHTKFGSFTKKEFLEGPAKSKVLTNEEIDHVRDALEGLWLINERALPLDISRRAMRFECTCGRCIQDVWHECIG